MKQNIFFVCLFVLLLIPVASARLSIHEYLDKADEYHYLVLGEESQAGDSSAAIDIALGIQNTIRLDIETVLEGEISENLSKILVGHPCENKLIDLPCEEWPYDEGVGLIKVDGVDLIVSGTTVNDRRRAAKILFEYPTYQELEDNFFVYVLGTTLESAELTIEKGKLSTEFVCGDGVCERGERFLCVVDCEKTCFDLCEGEGFASAQCREVRKENDPICKENEVNKGIQYCAGGRSCCCQPEEEEPEVPEEVIVPEKELSWWEKFLAYIAEGPQGKAWVAGIISALVIILLAGYTVLKR